MAPMCSYCIGVKSKLVPMRFVMACPKGHLADVPWRKWAHSRGKGVRKCERSDLRFITRPGGSGLDFVFVRCSSCGEERSLAGITTRDSLRALHVTCTGRQPWQMKDQPCDAIPQVLQRGATNLTFAAIESSIDIPPYSDYTNYASKRSQVINWPQFSIIASAPTSPLSDILKKQIASALKMEIAEINQIIDSELRARNGESNISGSIDNGIESLLWEEYQAFLSPDNKNSDLRDRFIKRLVPMHNGSASTASMEWLGKQIQSVVQITKLREVRVLRGFSRLTPVASISEDGEQTGMFSVYSTSKKTPPVLVPADLDGLRDEEKWLPAIEVFGEGIFIALHEDAMQVWENHASVKQRVKVLVERCTSMGSFVSKPTPRLILLHTLAHILIRQLSFECGYALSSLRERIYAHEALSMAGILIYTAAGDAEGTLGGLVREGEINRLFATIIKALQMAEWCSSDPLCRESYGQGFDAMNLAACHVCSLLPETSCTMSNRLLDRALLFGNVTNPHLGFFAPLMKLLLSSLATE